MKLHTLQLFLRNLVEPITQLGAPAESGADIRRACDVLASLGEMNVGQFADLVDQTREYQVTKQHAIPAYLQPVIARYDALAALKARATAPDVNREELGRDLEAAALDSLDLEDLTRLASVFGWEVKLKARKPDGKKAEVIDAIWLNLTGQAKPKPTKAKTSRPRASKPKVTVPIEEYAQKINDLKERANAPDVSRDELEGKLKELNLKQLSKDDLVALARQLSRDVNSKTKKDAAIDAIERMVLEVKEMQLAGTH
jgi:hypothetical protein